MANGAAEDVRTANSDRWTRVYVAAAGGHVEVLVLLERLGAAPDARVADRGRQTPFLPASWGPPDRVSLLLRPQDCYPCLSFAELLFYCPCCMCVSIVALVLCFSTFSFWLNMLSPSFVSLLSPCPSPDIAHGRTFVFLVSPFLQ